MSKERNIQEMTQYRDRLIKQMNFLVEILSKIDNEIGALEVERLHLRNSLLTSERSGNEMLRDASKKKNSAAESTTSSPDPSENLKEELDLSVPQSRYDCEEEEIDDEEIIQDEMKILDQLDLLL